jgi:EAL domain-containing protein (putative c-di-GMP-specific phosphodiesterase class I)
MTSSPRESAVRAQQDGVHLDDVAVAELTRAVAAGEVRPWYQPIVRLANRELVGFEALARWHRPSGIVELPGAFIGLAEESGLVTTLDLAVLDQAAADLARWRECRPDLRISVNFSARHLDDSDWVDTVHARTTAHGVPPGNVDVELTESARPRDLARGAEQLARLRELGYAVWFDDFGTGWSELTHLVEVPVDGMKIDRFFTERLGGRADAVVRALLQVAADLGLATTIEGISTTEQAERALALGCDRAQGFLWSAPLAPDEADRWVASSVAAP